MIIRKLLRLLFSTLLITDLVSKYKSRCSYAKIKAAQVYVQGVIKTRLFFLGILFVLIAFVFMINGLSLVHTALLTYSSWSNEVKFFALLGLGSVEFFGALAVFYYLFSEKTWDNFTEVNSVVSSAIDKNK